MLRRAVLISPACLSRRHWPDLWMSLPTTGDMPDNAKNVRAFCGATPRCHVAPMETLFNPRSASSPPSIVSKPKPLKSADTWTKAGTYLPRLITSPTRSSTPSQRPDGTGCRLRSIQGGKELYSAKPWTLQAAGLRHCDTTRNQTDHAFQRPTSQGS
ncbi:hypothetical protein Micbo1qcDRAFT_33470 [Microdochium bolleyi]|uniref:Uncharacterized protein n=1 Tax=Microdochium bolleyi TaxID=196109 RepID=A0A136IPX5_9PEZI|nr:hypothetical protein Micbo1qcDRAFT_33470 [Microdochium bolleyi]